MINEFVDNYAFLSNDYQAHLAYKGKEYNSVTEAFNSLRVFARTREVGERAKTRTMRSIVFRKFLQNPELAQKLVNTDTRPLINGGTWQDTFWGVDELTGDGENHLGRAGCKLGSDRTRLTGRLPFIIGAP